MKKLILLLWGVPLAAVAMDHDPMYSYTRMEAGAGRVAPASVATQRVLLDGWYGGDINRLWWQADAQREDGTLAARGAGVWYGRYVAPFWDAQIGVRSEGLPGAAEQFISAGVRGLAPYQYDTDLKLEMRSDGKMFAHTRFEQEWLLTNQWILRPALEGAWAFSDLDATVRSGLYQLTVGMQLRHEFTRKFAPYLEASRTVYPRAMQGGMEAGTNTLLGLRLIF